MVTSRLSDRNDVPRHFVKDPKPAYSGCTCDRVNLNQYLIAMAILIVALVAPVGAQSSTGNVYPSLSNIELQNTTSWMQLVSDRLAFSGPAGWSSTPTVARITDGTLFQTDVELASRSSTGNSLPKIQLVSTEFESPNEWSVWTQGYGLNGNIAGRDTAGGSGYRAGGTLLGIDRKLDENTLIGVFGGYTGTSFGNREDASFGRMNDYQIGIYERCFFEPFYFSNIDTFDESTFSVTRPDIADPVGRIHSNQWAHYSEIGKNYGETGLRFQPFLGMQYILYNQRAFTESGSFFGNLTSSHQINESLRGSIGARVYYDLTWRGILFSPTVSARYQREFGDGQPGSIFSFASFPGFSFQTPGNYLGRDFGLFSLGGTARVSSSLSFYANCGTLVSAYSSSVVGSGGVQFEW